MWRRWRRNGRRRVGACTSTSAFWGGVIPGNAGELDGLVDAGVRGFKCFLVPSGVDEFPHVTERDLREALPILARRRVPLLVHAELPEFLGSGARGFQPSGYATYLASRPPRAEREAIDMMIRLAREFSAHVHIVHVACAEAVDSIARAKADGVPITAETCPHYLTFTAADIGPAPRNSNARRQSARRRIATRCGPVCSRARSISSPPIIRRRRRR